MRMTAMAVLAGSMLCSAPAEGWQAGVARVDITPEEPMWLAGYASRDHAAEGTLHPLWLKALALQDAEGRRAVLVTSDLLGFPKPASDRIRNRLKEGLQLDRAQIILSASHTHSGPVLDASLLCIYPMDAAELDKVKRYTARLEEQTVAAVEQAFAALEPVQLASANGVTRFAVNRRNNQEAKILETYDLNGPVDHAVPVIRVTGEAGSLKALVFGYACHGTTLSGYEWCGDYAGFAQIALEEAHPGATAMFFAGCGGNQNPLPRRSVALAKQYGEELAASVQRVLAEPLEPLDAALACAYRETELMLNDPPTREELVAMTKKGSDYMRRAAEEMIAILDAGRALRTSYPYPVAMWRLGKQTVVVMGGEVVVDYAIFAKQMLGHDTFVMGYANDVMSYIPSEVVLEEGGYEGDTSQFIYGMPAKWKTGIEAQVLGVIRDLAAQVGVPAQAKP